MNTQPERALRRIIIVGGGSAGWMAAMSLANALRGNCAIELVESEEIGIVGVGEATIPPIKQYLRGLGIDEESFVRATRASFKLGIQFDGWGGEGDRYFHPFGTYGINFDMVPIYQYWLRAHLCGDPTPLDDYSMCAVAARHGRFAHPVDNPRMVQSTLDYAYHFDAGLFARFLRTRAQAAGVVRTEGKVVDVRRAADTGFITSVELADGRSVSGDFFIDCSGFAGLLLGRAMGVGYHDWSCWLPCDRAVAVASDGGAERPPFTRSTARAAGWQWRIPLQHRIGNGYVFSSVHLSEDEASTTLLGSLEGTPIGDPRVLRFTTGRRHSFWTGNCLALGLAAGFMEPLESTSLHLVQSGITRFLALFPDRDCDPAGPREYDRLTAEEYERIRDFLILHYHANRRDEPLWQASRAMKLPDSLDWRIDHFRKHGRIVSPGPELFQNPSWIAVLIGQGIIPARHDPLIDQRRPAEADARLASLRSIITAAAGEMPRHETWLKRLGMA
ncbi:tryptophan halogenase [Sphingomonas sp. UYAg733]